MPACDSPIFNQNERSDGLAGVVRDRSAQPIADARIEITDGPFAGRFTTSNAAGEFQFSDPSSVSELVTLRIFKPGYRSAYARPDRFRIVVTLLSMDDQHTITFTAAETCSALPSSVRSRSNTTTLWDFTPGSLDLPLTGADFFPGLKYHGGPDSRFPRTIFCVERRGVPAMGRWFPDLRADWRVWIPVAARDRGTGNHSNSNIFPNELRLGRSHIARLQGSRSGTVSRRNARWPKFNVDRIATNLPGPLVDRFLFIEFGSSRFHFGVARRMETALSATNHTSERGVRRHRERASAARHLKKPRRVNEQAVPDFIARHGAVLIGFGCSSPTRTGGRCLYARGHRRSRWGRHGARQDRRRDRRIGSARSA